MSSDIRSQRRISGPRAPLPQPPTSPGGANGLPSISAVLPSTDAISPRSSAVVNLPQLPDVSELGPRERELLGRYSVTANTNGASSAVSPSRPSQPTSSSSSPSSSSAAAAGSSSPSGSRYDGYGGMAAYNGGSSGAKRQELPKATYSNASGRAGALSPDTGFGLLPNPVPASNNRSSTISSASMESSASTAAASSDGVDVRTPASPSPQEGGSTTPYHTPPSAQPSQFNGTSPSFGQVSGTPTSSNTSTYQALGGSSGSRTNGISTTLVSTAGSSSSASGAGGLPASSSLPTMRTSNSLGPLQAAAANPANFQPTTAAAAAASGAGPTTLGNAASRGTNTSSNNSRVNVVTYRSSSIKALIDPALSVSDVIRQLCANSHLGVQEPPALFALRDEQNDELVTDENLKKKIESRHNFKLCSSPTIEAVEMVEKLWNARSDDRILKIATYTLQRLIREAPFASEFLNRGGLKELMKVIMSFPLDVASVQKTPVPASNIGVNTLAYALCSCQNLMETFDDGWEELEGNFINKVVQILARMDRINVCRPATAILRKLVLAGPSEPEEGGGLLGSGQSIKGGDAASIRSGKSTLRPSSLLSGTPGNVGAGSSGASVHGNEKTETGPDGMPLLLGITKFGFEVIYRHIAMEPALLSTLVQRLSSADTTLCLYSLSLLNSLMRHVSEARFDEFISELEGLGISRAVSRLMMSNQSEELVPGILDFQANIVRVANHRMRTNVTPQNKRHVSALSYIWLQARITEVAADPPPAPRDSDGSGVTSPTRYSSSYTLNSRFKWRRLGFGSEAVAKEFGKMGWLALENCEAFVRSDPDAYSKIIAEQINRPEERRCPFGKASIEVTEILVDHWNIEHPGFSSVNTFQPFLLFFNRVHGLALRFFLRMWTESGANTSDFTRVAALARSQVKVALHDEGSKTWFDLERAFLESEYRTVRERQMKELEVEDEYANKSSIRHLRNRLYRESYEFVRQQRIQCLLEGAWFLNPAAQVQSRGMAATMANERPGSSLSTLQGSGGMYGRKTPAPNKMWRFYRLSPNKKHLHYCESTERVPIRGGLDDLPERIDLVQVTDISVSNMAQQIRNANDPSARGGQNQAEMGSANLTFGLIHAPDTLIAEMGALSQSQFSEWVDGLSMMRGEGGVVSTKDTSDFIQVLTEIAVQVKLLDLTGERIEVPNSIPAVPAPYSTEFFYADL